MYFIYVSVFVFIMIIPCNAHGDELNQASALTRQEKIQKAKDYYKLGDQLLKEGNYSQADEEFKKAQGLLEEVAPTPVLKDAKQLPRFQEKPAALKAAELSKSGQSKEAIKFYLEAVELEPKNSNIYYNLAIEYLKTKQNNLAADIFLKLIKLNTKDKDAYYNLGILYDSYLGNKPLAFDFYNKYLKLAPNADDADLVRSWANEINKTLDLK